MLPQSEHNSRKTVVRRRTDVGSRAASITRELVNHLSADRRALDLLTRLLEETADDLAMLVPPTAEAQREDGWRI